MHALSACSQCMLSMHAVNACSQCMLSVHALNACSFLHALNACSFQLQMHAHVTCRFNILRSVKTFHTHTHAHGLSNVCFAHVTCWFIFWEKIYEKPMNNHLQAACLRFFVWFVQCCWQCHCFWSILSQSCNYIRCLEIIKSTRL